MSVVRTLARLSRLLEHSGAEVSLPQYRLLALVAEGDERAGALAGRLALSKPAVTAAVDGLAERGLVVRSEVADNRRAVSVAITGEGPGRAPTRRGGDDPAAGAGAEPL